MNIQRKNLSSYNDVFEKKTVQIKFVSFLIKIGIIPMHLSREGKFIFKVFSWKLIVYLFLNVGCICLCKYAQIFVSGQSISEIIGRRTSIDIVSTLIREGLENKKRIIIRYFFAHIMIATTCKIFARGGCSRPGNVVRKADKLSPTKAMWV